MSPTDMAAMNVPVTFHESLIVTVRDHFGREADTDGPIVDAVAEADEGLSATISWGRDSAEARRELEDAREVVFQVLRPLIEDSRDMLPLDLRLYVGRAIDNAGLDSPYRLLSLFPAQREAILALQHERDRVLRDARQRVRPSRVEAARATFEAQSRLLLTRFQQTELAQFQASIAANLDAVLDREMAGYPEPEETDDGRTAQSRLLGPARGGMAGAWTRLAQSLRAALAKIAPRRVATASLQ